MIALWLASCSVEIRSEPDPEPAPVWTIPEVWAFEAPSGSRLTIAEAVVISPRTAMGATFYVQHPGGGPGSGLQVHVGDGIHEWPPPIGTPVLLRGVTTMFAGGPTLWLDDRNDLVVLGPVEPVEPVAFADDPLQVWSLVRATDVVVTSSVDPAGIATTNLGYRLRPDFGVPTPGWNRSGDVVGVQSLAFALLMRSVDDWTGDWEGDPPLVTDLPGLHGLPDGTPVSVAGLVQATPWSRGDRYAVVQDTSGLGVWVDAEGFGAPASVEGDVGDWLGEVRYGGDGPRLRVWTDPSPAGTRDVVTYTDDPDLAPPGSLITTVVSGLQPIGPKGDRNAPPWLLDDRFVPLDDLTDPDVVRGAVRLDGDGIRRLAVLPE